jgi:hypothetical protein
VWGVLIRRFRQKGGRIGEDLKAIWVVVFEVQYKSRVEVANWQSLIITIEAGCTSHVHMNPIMRSSTFSRFWFPPKSSIIIQGLYMVPMGYAIDKHLETFVPQPECILPISTPSIPNLHLWWGCGRSHGSRVGLCEVLVFALFSVLWSISMPFRFPSSRVGSSKCLNLRS